MAWILLWTHTLFSLQNFPASWGVALLLAEISRENNWRLRGENITTLHQNEFMNININEYGKWFLDHVCIPCMYLWCWWAHNRHSLPGIWGCPSAGDSDWGQWPSPGNACLVASVAGRCLLPVKQIPENQEKSNKDLKSIQWKQLAYKILKKYVNS